MAIDKPVEELNEADLTALITSGTPELKTLEYKQTLPGGTESERKEFFADVSSFANSTGGHLIFGMRAEAGIPKELLGVDGNGDAAILSMENSIRDGIAPRIAGIHCTQINLTQTGKPVIVMHIPKSFAAPHMVQYKGGSRFYARTSNGKYQLDVHEIRAAFLGSEITSERIRDFRLDRISRIKGRELPIPLPAGPCALLHIIPLSSIGSSTRYDVIGLKGNLSIHQSLSPIFWSFVNNARPNFDGLLLYESNVQHPPGGYTQLYRSGIIESTDTTFLNSPEKFGKGKVIPSQAFESKLFRSVENYLSVLKSLDVDLPLLLTFALIGIEGFAMSRGNYGTSEQFDRDVIMPQEILIETYDVNVPSIMKPLLDEIWNAAGEQGSPYYKGSSWIGN